MSSFRSLLPTVEKAPANQHSKAKNTATQLKAKAAPAVIKECLDTTKTGGFTTRDIFEAVPEVKAAYETPNALGTCLGTGIKGTGMGLHSAKAVRKNYFSNLDDDDGAKWSSSNPARPSEA